MDLSSGRLTFIRKELGRAAAARRRASPGGNPVTVASARPAAELAGAPGFPFPASGVQGARENTMRRDPTRCTGTTEPLRATINVTPLVDVCLVLLIIFLVVTPLINEGVPVALPEAARPAPFPDRDGEVVISIRRDRSVWVDEQATAPASLAAALQRARAASPVRRVLLRGDRSLPYGAVRSVFKQLTEAGFAGAGLVTLRDQGPTGP